MNKITFELITNRNVSAGLHILPVYANDITGGLLMPLLLFAFWFIIAVGIYFAQYRQTGMVDFPVGLAVASFLTVGLAVMLRVIPGLISQTVLVITIAIAIASMMFLFFSNNKI